MTDAEGNTDTALVKISITDVSPSGGDGGPGSGGEGGEGGGGPTQTSNPPVFDPDFYHFTLEEDSALHTAFGSVFATDPDGQAVVYSLSGVSGPISVNSNTGQLMLTGSLDGSGGTSFSFQVTATDPDGLTDAASVTIEVRAANDPPSLNRLYYDPGVIDWEFPPDTTGVFFEGLLNDDFPDSSGSTYLVEFDLGEAEPAAGDPTSTGSFYPWGSPLEEGLPFTHAMNVNGVDEAGFAFQARAVEQKASGEILYGEWEEISLSPAAIYRMSVRAGWEAYWETVAQLVEAYEAAELDAVIGWFDGVDQAYADYYAQIDQAHTAHAEAVGDAELDYFRMLQEGGDVTSLVDFVESLPDTIGSFVEQWAAGNLNSQDTLLAEKIQALEDYASKLLQKELLSAQIQLNGDENLALAEAQVALEQVQIPAEATLRIELAQAVHDLALALKQNTVLYQNTLATIERTWEDGEAEAFLTLGGTEVDAWLAYVGSEHWKWFSFAGRTPPIGDFYTFVTPMYSGGGYDPGYAGDPSGGTPTDGPGTEPGDPPVENPASDPTSPAATEVAYFPLPALESGAGMNVPQAVLDQANADFQTAVDAYTAAFAAVVAASNAQYSQVVNPLAEAYEQLTLDRNAQLRQAMARWRPLICPLTSWPI